MRRADLEQAIFGSFDGAVSLLGMLVGLILVGASSRTVLVAAAGLAFADMVSMAGGQYLSDVERRGRIHRAAVMGFATLVGGLAPALPFAVLYGRHAQVAAGILVGLLAIVISEVRPESRLRSYVLTFSILLGATVFSVGASLVAGVA